MLLRKIGRVIEQPRVLIGKLRGIQQTFCFYCLTAEELAGRPIKTVIDVGANKGKFIEACKFVFPSAKVYAFEPIKELYEKIKRMGGVTAFNFGLWDKEGEDFLYYRKKASGASSFLRPLENIKQNKRMRDIAKIKSSKKRFDKLNIEIKRPCYLKIDVEGAEDRVIRGFGKKLEEIDIIQIEWIFKEAYEEQMKLGETISFLEKKGFTGFIQKAIVYKKNSTPVQCDLLFFKERKSEK
jgi:FkbM family methyltransferase